MDAEGLFQRVVEELESRVSEPLDEYDLMRASGLLRLLLLDGHRLIDHVGIGSRLTFELFPPVGVYITPGSDTGIFERAGIYRLEPVPGSRVHQLSLEQFLARTALNTSVGDFTVRQVIRCAAIALGGVHFGKSQDPEEQQLADLSRRMSARDAGLLGGTLAEVGRVTVAALRQARRS
jgi:hypothetical protein